MRIDPSDSFLFGNKFMRQRYRHAVIVLALRRAKDAVKHHIRAHGLKPNHYSAKEIIVWAELFLEDHRAELLAEAERAVERMVAKGVFGKKAQRELCLKLKTNAQTSKPQNSMTSAVQMSGAK